MDILQILVETKTQAGFSYALFLPSFLFVVVVVVIYNYDSWVLALSIVWQGQ